MKHRVLLLACGIALLAAACSPSAPTEPANPSVPLPGAPEREDLPVPPKP
jgi:hypothetical protein